MLSAVILWAGILLETGVVFRGLLNRTFSKFPFFYTYSTAVLIRTVFLLFPGANHNWYWYWMTQFLTLVIGYGILLEIFRNVLADYPGAEKFARFAVVTVFGMILLFTLVFPALVPHSSAHSLIETRMIEFERNLRTVQALFICVLLCVIAYYGIVLGRNMKGMILGYGIYIGTSLLSLAARAYGGIKFDEAWKVIQPLSYDASLAVWLLALWSYCPNPVSRSTLTLEKDYEALVYRTRETVGSMRSHLGKTTR